MRMENEKSKTMRSSQMDMAEKTPRSEFYATIKGPNYDNIWVTHENFGRELDEQVKDKTDFHTQKQFMGMTDDELLMNKSLFQRMGLVKGTS